LRNLAFISRNDQKNRPRDSLGLFGGLVGGWLFDQLGIAWGGLLGQLGTAIVGAVAILWVASLIKK
jgi:uncharacterized membrane protein YeaQ/YmgE (transglycosylase-associated protein family)